MNDKKNRNFRVYQYIQKITEEAIIRNQFKDSGAEALSCALDLKLDRANVSKEMNVLWKDGKIIKVQGKPVYYFDYEIIRKHYPESFVPSVISKDETLGFYLSKEVTTVIEETEDDPLNTLIGAQGSLSDLIIKAKSAVAYPPYGLSTLISGHAGVGKTQLANSMAKYAANEGFKSIDSPFLTIYCRNYADDPKTFASILLGIGKTTKSKLQKGMLEEAEGGILVLDQIEYLSDSSMDLLCALITQSIYSRIHESMILPVKTMFIVTTNESLDSSKIKKISEVIPINLQLLDIDQRGIYEKIEIIMDLLAQEAKDIQYPIKVHKDIIACFALMKYENNIAQMRNEIKIACSRAFLDTIPSQFKTVYVSYQHLSHDLLSFNENNSELKPKITTMLSSIPNDYLVFDEMGKSNGANYFKNAPSVFSDLRISQFVNEFNVDIESLDNLEDYVSENISCLKNCEETQLHALKRNIHPMVFQIVVSTLQQRQRYSLLLNNTHLLYGILLHITNLIKRFDNQIMNVNSNRVSVTEAIYHQEYLDAKEIYQSFNSLYNLPMDSKEIDFLASYLAIVNQWVNETNVALLVICHGETIASQMVDFVRESVKGTYYLDGIDFKNNLQLNDCLELACIKATELNQGAGVLVMCDMAPLTSVSEYIIKKTGIPSKTISGVSLPYLLQVIEKSMQSINDIDTLIMKTNVESANNPTGPNSYNFIQNITDRIIAKTVDFIDTQKAVDVLMICLTRTLEGLDIPYSDEIAVKYLCHCVNMIERVIRKEPWDYQHLNSFSLKNYQLMHHVEHSLEYASDTFSLKIPSTELAYVTEIFLGLQSIK